MWWKFGPKIRKKIWLKRVYLLIVESSENKFVQPQKKRSTKFDDKLKKKVLFLFDKKT